MSYIEKAKQNQLNADKAAAFDKMRQEQRDRDVYSVGTEDAYSEVEKTMARRAQQKAQQKLSAIQNATPVRPAGFDDVQRYVNKKSTSNRTAGVPTGLASSLMQRK